MIRWAFFSTLAIGLFWLVYRLTLGRDRWFQLSRVYIVSTLVFGLVFPLVRIPVASLTGGMSLTVLDEVVVGSSIAATSSVVSAVGRQHIAFLVLQPRIDWEEDNERG